MLEWLVYAGLALGLMWLSVRLLLTGPDHGDYDLPVQAALTEVASAENAEVEAMIGKMRDEIATHPRTRRLQATREYFDRGLGATGVEPDELGISVLPCDAAGVAAEWVVAPEADTRRRLLYVHGGGFYVGSPRSHRMLTAALSRACRAAVLVPDYGLMPENSRMQGIKDVRTGYQWMLRNGPDGPSEAGGVLVAGDSAGGNLALMLAAWVRDEGLRSIDAVIAFSPSTDSTLSSPSLRGNLTTDPLIGPALRPFLRLPKTIQLLLALLGSRINPRNPIVSPLFDDLKGLPPTLILASESEMLRDDSQRYANKARKAGSPVELKTWAGMVHVWPMFLGTLPEANQAMEHVGAFVERTLAVAAPATPN